MNLTGYAVNQDLTSERHRLHPNRAMFERFTEKARRVIFFARYEATEYGSPSIETEHLLLGLVREDIALSKMFLGQRDVLAEIRAEVEKHVTRKERISTSVEVPLSVDCKQILTSAAKEGERLGVRHIGTEHILLAMLSVEGSVAANILHARGLKPKELRLLLSKISSVSSASVKAHRDDKAKQTLDNFLAALKWDSAEQLVKLFAQNAQFIDVFGKRWSNEEICKGFEKLFATYAKKNAIPHVEEILADGSGVFVASVVWKNAILASLERIWIHRMSVVLLRENEDWHILLIHVTPVQP